MKAASADEFYAGADRFFAELAALRAILLEFPFEETVKWGAPFYCVGGVNVVGVAAFKDHFALWFPQGALLADARRVLVNAQEGKTAAQRQWRMRAAGDIKPAILRAYLKEAIALARAGARVPQAKPAPARLPAELDAALRADSRASAAFARLSEGRRREYAAYIAEAKLEATRARRVAKVMPMIRAGVGLNDAYRR